MAVCTYIFYFIYSVWKALSNPDIELALLYKNYLPLVERQGLIRLTTNDGKQKLIRLFQLLSYFKKSIIVVLIFLGSNYGNY